MSLLVEFVPNCGVRLLLFATLVDISRRHGSFGELGLKYQLKHPEEQYIPVLGIMLTQLFTYYLFGQKTQSINYGDQHSRTNIGFAKPS